MMRAKRGDGCWYVVDDSAPEQGPDGAPKFETSGEANDAIEDWYKSEARIAAKRRLAEMDERENDAWFERMMEAGHGA
jgi:hypothetical protein